MEQPENTIQVPAISKTGLDKIDVSPLDYWWHFLRPERPEWTPDKNTAFDIALRMAVFAPRDFAKKYVRAPEIKKTTNLGKSEWASILAAAERNGQLLLTPSEFDTIKRRPRWFLQA